MPPVRSTPHDRRVLLLALASGFPALIAALVFLLSGRTISSSPGPGLAAEWVLVFLLLAWWFGCAWMARDLVIRPLQTIANLISALGEGDFSIRARGARRGDALGEALLEVNALSTTLRQQRLGAVEATALLHAVIKEIDLAIYAFDDRRKLRLVNRAGERLLAQSADQILGRTASDLTLDSCLEGEPARTFQSGFPGGAGRWGMRRTSFRQDGRPHQLLVLADLSQALRDEERQAWQRLLRVLGHELNNSLAPIQSIADSLAALLNRSPLPEDWRDDLRSGLQVITSRTQALNRFLASYARLARLPPPKLAPVELAPLIHRVASLETRLEVQVRPGPLLTLQADVDQLEQLLINLIRNAADAALETHGGVRVDWRMDAADTLIQVEDDGPGLSNTTNLFVPFFTTKRDGSGIGLALGRQIAEAHRGSLTLQNRSGHSGCIASLRLPAIPGKTGA